MHVYEVTPGIYKIFSQIASLDFRIFAKYFKVKKLIA